MAPAASGLLPDRVKGSLRSELHNFRAPRAHGAALVGARAATAF